LSPLRTIITLIPYLKIINSKNGKYGSNKRATQT
jgi:hypothetical protein